MPGFIYRKQNRKNETTVNEPEWDFNWDFNSKLNSQWDFNQNIKIPLKSHLKLRSQLKSHSNTMFFSKKNMFILKNISNNEFKFSF